MNPKLKAAQELFFTESQRFRNLAAELALGAFTNVPLDRKLDGTTEEAQRARLIRDHLVRAETFRDAALLLKSAYIPTKGRS